MEEQTENKNELTKKQKIKLRAKASALKFKKELKKSIATAIIAAFGFLMALAWRDVITEAVDKITSISPLNGKIFSALIITVVSVIGILLITSLLKDKDEQK